MAKYEVRFIREEVSIERCYVEVEAASPEDAMERVRLHYMEGESALTTEETYTEEHLKCCGVEESRVVEIEDARELV
jgi:hypothetical protein